MCNITWEEALKDNSVPVYLSLSFFATTLHVQTCSLSSLWGWLCWGCILPWGACLPPSPMLHLGLSSWIIFHFLLKNPVPSPNKSHTHSCEPAAGSECTVSLRAAGMPGTGAVLGGRQEDKQSSQGHFTIEQKHHLALQASSECGSTPHCLTLVPSHTSVANTCRYDKRCLCEGTIVLHKCQWEIRLAGISFIHSRCIYFSLGFLLPQVVFALAMSYHAGQKFWKGSPSLTLSFIFLFFSLRKASFCSEGMKQLP